MDNENIVTTEQNESQEQQTFTLAEVEAMLQREGDRRVNSAMAKKQKEIEQLRKQIANEKTLSQMDEEKRAVAEKDMRITELEEQLSDYRTAQTKAEVMKVLSARGLSPEFADIITIGEDLEEAQSKIEALDKLIKKAITSEVKNRLAGASNIPQVATHGGKMTREEFNKLSLADQQAIYRTDPDLYNELTRR